MSAHVQQRFSCWWWQNLLYSAVVLCTYLKAGSTHSYKTSNILFFQSSSLSLSNSSTTFVICHLLLKDIRFTCESYVTPFGVMILTSCLAFSLFLYCKMESNRDILPLSTVDKLGLFSLLWAAGRCALYTYLLSGVKRDDIVWMFLHKYRERRQKLSTQEKRKQNAPGDGQLWCLWEGLDSKTFLDEARMELKAYLNSTQCRYCSHFCQYTLLVSVMSFFGVIEAVAGDQKSNSLPRHPQEKILDSFSVDF